MIIGLLITLGAYHVHCLAVKGIHIGGHFLPLLDNQSAQNAADCSKAAFVEQSDTCYSFTSRNSVTINDFNDLNGAGACWRLVPGRLYCLSKVPTVDTNTTTTEFDGSPIPETVVVMETEKATSLETEPTFATTSTTASTGLTNTAATTTTTSRTFEVTNAISNGSPAAPPIDSKPISPDSDSQRNQPESAQDFLQAPTVEFSSPAPAPAPVPEVVVVPEVERISDVTDGSNLSLSDQAEMLSAHNNFRAQYGIGPLQYDASIAAHAAGWASTLAAQGCALVHGGHEGFGQNLYMQSSSGQASASMQDMFGGWSVEPVDEGYNHATQALWYSTQFVGCAVQWGNGGRCQVLVCDYFPPGNMMGLSFFGTPA
ncbi:CAP domain-containing protein [Obelidium mucronatum]|nr:CAP domain-containing protein [Obelidium mucronatum]